MGDIKVNAQAWSGIAKEQQDKIQEILQKNRLLLAGDRIAPDPTAQAPEAGVAMDAEAGLCTLLCTVAETAAIAACAALPGPANAVCIAAAKAAGEFCRSKC